MASTLPTTSTEEVSPPLTDKQRAQIERNRQHALLLKQARLSSHPYMNANDRTNFIGNSKFVDTGGGFLLEESTAPIVKKVEVKDDPTFRIAPTDTSECIECHRQFLESKLLTQFDLTVCDDCRDDEDKHSVITKTDAKKEFLLKDVDLEKREPILKFIIRKNPHNPRWGDMKLFLKQQVFRRAIEVWGSEENIEEERLKRTENREKVKKKKFNKRVKELRMSVRSSAYTKDISTHEHSYGPEESDEEEEDSYRKTCTICGYVLTFEKM